MADVAPEHVAQVFRIGMVLNDIAYPGFRFVLGGRPDVLALRVKCLDAKDVTTGEPVEWQGRYGPLSLHMTDGEVVQTALLAVLTALEHEAREHFTYRGVSIFNPHYDLNELVALRQREDGALRERAV